MSDEKKPSMAQRIYDAIKAGKHVPIVKTDPVPDDAQLVPFDGSAEAVLGRPLTPLERMLSTPKRKP